MTIDFERDAAEAAAQSPDRLKKLVALAHHQLADALEIEQLEARLKQKKADYAKLVEVTIPEAMLEAGVQSVTLPNGMALAVERQVFASIPEAKRPHAHAWLRANGHGGLIKTEITVAFDKGEEVKARTLAEELAARGLTIAAEERVHPSTLKAFVREQLDRGTVLPEDGFSVFEKKVATVKLPKKAR